MAKYIIILSKKAQKALDTLSDHIAEPVFKSIAALEENPRPAGCKKLKGRDAYRIRFGDYRIIYEIIDEQLIIDVVAVGHRKDIYR
jgi:mRNA interferase RelE/StbE